MNKKIKGGVVQKQRGFSLVELLVVIFIIAILASVIIVSLERARMRSRDNHRKSDLAVIQQALEMYYADQHKFPTRAEDTGQWGNVQTLGNPKTGFSAYLAPIPQDPQQTPYFRYGAFKVDNTYHYMIISTLENESDPDYNRNYSSTWWGTAPQQYAGYLTTNYGSGKTYHYFVSSD